MTFHFEEYDKKDPKIFQLKIRMEKGPGKNSLKAKKKDTKRLTQQMTPSFTLSAKYFVILSSLCLFQTSIFIFLFFPKQNSFSATIWHFVLEGFNMKREEGSRQLRIESSKKYLPF